MKHNSEIIKTEIIRILNESGKISGSELVKRVTKKVGSEKLVYREIGALIESGEIERKIHDKKHIEYELINLYESVNNQLKNLFREIAVIDEEIQNFDAISKKDNYSFHERLRSVIHFIQIVQSIDSIMKLLSFYPAFKKDRMFPQINRKIRDSWNEIMKLISCQKEEEFLNEVFSNIRVSELNSRIVN